MKIHFQRPAVQRPGFTLVMTLTILAAVTILVVGLFSMSSGEKQISASFDAVEQADLAVKAGLAKASSLLDEATKGDDAVIFSKPLEPPADTQGRSREQLMAARYDTASSKWLYIPLLSGAARPDGTTKLVMDVDGNGQVDAPQPLVPPTTEELQALTNLPKTLPWKARPVCYWESLTVPKPVAGTGDELVSRFCFAVEDLQGLINLNEAGNTDGTGDSHNRPPSSLTVTTVPGLATTVPGLNVADTAKPLLNQTALYTVMYPTASDDSTLMKMDNRLVKARYALLTPDNWKDALSLADGASGWTAATPDTFKRDAATGRLVDTASRALEENTGAGMRPYSELALIPWFPNASTVTPAFAGYGDRKLNLNHWLVEIEKLTGAAREAKAKEAVGVIAAHIQAHLPQFAKGRRGGYPLGGVGSTDKDLAYLKCLAAGMLDYADTDSLPTMEDGQYRGTDSYPLVNEQWQRYRLVSTVKESGGWYANFTITHFVELWNPTNKPVTGEVNLAFECKGTITVGAGIYGVEDALQGAYGTDATYTPAMVKNATDQKWWQGPLSITLQPNQYTVLEFPAVTFKLRTGPSSGSAVTTSEFAGTGSAQSDLSSRYWLKFKPAGSADFALVDRPLLPVERYVRRPSTSNRQYFNTTHPGMSYALQNSNYANEVGDPRSAYFIDYHQDVVNYDEGSNPWGRNKRSNIGDDKLYKENRIYLWPDGGHNTTGFGHQKIGSNNKNPTDAGLTKAATEPDKYVQRLSNAGKLYSVSELGHIFDPVMWDPNGGTEYDTPTYLQLSDIRTGTLATASGKYCGGNTLRIGRPEHTRFRPDYRTSPPGGRQLDRKYCATALLDIFHTGIPTSGDDEKVTGPLVPISGHVNLNTATRDALRALAAGKLVMDPQTKTSSATGIATLYPPKTGTGAPQADQIADFIIQNRPFLSPSELPERLMVKNSDDPILGKTIRQDDATATNKSAVVMTPEWSDPAAEEVFARIFNSSTVRSRNFRIVVTGQAVRQTRTGTIRVLATRASVYHVFVRPERDADGNITSQKIEVTYARNL